MEVAAGQPRSLLRALAGARPQERPGCPPASSAKAEARVLVINTGGTIGMVQDVKGLAPEANKLVSSLKTMPMLHDEAYARETKLNNCHEFPENTLVLPLSKQNKRIFYTILELSPLLDSSNMTPDDWAKIAKKLEEHYEKYDGFVILHGTDTMAYTASALSFMCENLGKTIVLTGSQVPIYELQNDGRDNLLGALLMAGQFVIPEVCLYFYNKLYRGNRVTKVDAGSFNAFSSPNLPPLANAEVDITINWETVWRANTKKKFRVHTNMNRNVGLLRIFPGITAAAVKAFLQPPIEGIVLETYGSGNAPDKREDLLEELSSGTLSARAENSDTWLGTSSEQSQLLVGFVVDLGLSLVRHRVQIRGVRFIHIIKVKSQSIRAQQMDTCKAPSPVSKEGTNFFMDFGNSEGKDQNI